MTILEDDLISELRDILEDISNLHFSAAYGTYDELNEMKSRADVLW